MRRVLRWLRNIVVLLVVIIGGLWIFGPREPIETEINFDTATLGDDLDAYLTERESRFSDITAGTAKRVVWAAETSAQTDWAVVNIHSYSATSEEIRPVPDQVAAGLGANCSIPDDHIDPRRSALFMARSILNEVRDGRSAC